VFNQERETHRSSANEIRVVLADDHQLFRQGLKALLELERGITIVGEASDGLEVQRISLEQNANVVLMDINMPIVDGLSATRELLRAKDRKSTRLNSSHANISYAVFCLKKKKSKGKNWPLWSHLYQMRCGS